VAENPEHPVVRDDPTFLTTMRIEREIQHLRELMESRFANTDANVVELEASLARRIASLDALTDSKFVTHRTLLDSQADKVALALAAADKAVNKAEAATEKRFDAVNEFREQLNDQTKTFVGRAEYAAMHESMIDKVDELRRVSNLNTGKGQGLQAGWGYIVGVISLIVIVVNVVIAFATKS